MYFWKKTIVLAALLSLGNGVALASTPYYAHATATETNVFLGQVFNLDIIVKASEKPNAPELDEISEFNITELLDGKSTSTTNTWLYRYALRAKQEGQLTLPPMPFGTVQTEPIHFQVKKPETTDRMKITQKLSASSVYAGEPIILTTIWDSTYPFGAIKAVDFHFPILNDNRFNILERYEPNQNKNKQATGLPVHGTRVLATRNSYKVEETQHQTLSFSKILIPKKSGKIIIPPATLLCAAAKEKDATARLNRKSAFQYPAYFDNTFFDQNATGDHWQRIYTESPPLELVVKPLPAQDRPSLFNGMVGDFSIEVEAEPTTVRVGEPITLTITITASNYIENIFFEPLRYQPNLVNHFEIPSDRSLPQRQGKSKIYTQTIRPLSISNSEIPPLQLAFFNPITASYQTAQSKAIALTVAPAEEIGIYGAHFDQNRLRTVDDGIRQNYEKPDMLKSSRLPLLGWGSPFIVWIILIIPPLLMGGFALIDLFGKKKHHIHRTAKAARAFAVFRKNAAHIRHHSMKSEIYNDLDRVLRAYLGDRLHLRPGALSFREAKTKLAKAGASTETLKALQSLFSRCEAYRFTANYDEKGNAKQIIRNATLVVKSVEKTLR